MDLARLSQKWFTMVMTVGVFVVIANGCAMSGGDGKEVFGPSGGILRPNEAGTVVFTVDGEAVQSFAVSPGDTVDMYREVDDAGEMMDILAINDAEVVKQTASDTPGLRFIASR